MNLTRKVKIETLADGAVNERLQMELDSAIKNCLDINKQQNFTRKVTLEIKIKPDQERTSAMVAIEASSKLAPLEAVPVQFLFDREAKEAYEVAVKQQELPFDHKEGKITHLNRREES